ncbi:hypothetical protein ACWIGN_30330, partial [Streptomyces albidoflavus]
MKSLLLSRKVSEEVVRAVGQGPAQALGDVAVQAERGVVVGPGEEGRPQGPVGGGSVFDEDEQFES